MTENYGRFAVVLHLNNGKKVAIWCDTKVERDNFYQLLYKNMNQSPNGFYVGESLIPYWAISMVEKIDEVNEE